MASSTTKNDANYDNLDSNDAELDFLSPNFNPEKALTSESVLVPYPEIKSFSSLSTYKAVIDKRKNVKQKAKDNEKLSQQTDLAGAQLEIIQPSNSTELKNACITEAPEALVTRGDSNLAGGEQPNTNTAQLSQRLKGSGQSNDNAEVPETAKSRGQRINKNVFTRMMNVVGPLSLLKRCIEDHLLVRVVTRGAVLVRGVCRGYIVAFDKYFNMALTDVIEIYRSPITVDKKKGRRLKKLKDAKKVLLQEREQLHNKQNITKPVINQICSGIQECQLITAQSKAGASSDEKSVYTSVEKPYSPYEREALILGIPDENVCIRNVGQVFIRGDNIVSVSLVYF